jgi:hypothetical protein
MHRRRSRLEYSVAKYICIHRVYIYRWLITHSSCAHAHALTRVQLISEVMFGALVIFRLLLIDVDAGSYRFDVRTSCCYLQAARLHTSTLSWPVHA